MYYNAIITNVMLEEKLTWTILKVLKSKLQFTFAICRYYESSNIYLSHGSTDSFVCCHLTSDKDVQLVTKACSIFSPAIFSCVYKIAKNDCLLRHVCPSVDMKELGSHWADFHKT
jgi:hypothetical protein